VLSIQQADYHQDKNSGEREVQRQAERADGHTLLYLNSIRVLRECGTAKDFSFWDAPTVSCWRLIKINRES
jgi:hypothetical protein